MIDEILAISTSTLAIITAVYVYLTHKIFKEQEVARKEAVIPKLMGKLHYVGPVSPYLRIENVGRGPAIESYVEFRVLPNGGEHKWYHPLISPHEHFTLTLPLSEKERKSDALFQKYDSIELQYQYKDLYGKIYEDQSKIDLKEFHKGLTEGNSRVLWEQEDLKKIAQHLDQIRKDIHYIHEDFSRIRDKFSGEGEDNEEEKNEE
jgi:hypothetical protein